MDTYNEVSGIYAVPRHEGHDHMKRKDIANLHPGVAALIPPSAKEALAIIEGVLARKVDNWEGKLFTRKVDIVGVPGDVDREVVGPEIKRKLYGNIWVYITM